MTLDRITKGFVKTIKQLDNFVKVQDLEIERAKKSQFIAKNKENMAAAQKAKAQKIKQNIEGIIQ